MHAGGVRAETTKSKLLLQLLSGAAFVAEWQAIERVPVDRKIEITTRDGTVSRADFVSLSGDVLAFRETSGGRTLARAEIRKVRVYDAGRRVRKGLLWMLVGAGAGAGAGVAACPYCPNEGHGSPYIGVGAAAWAGIGALGFLSSPYRTIYKSK